jgi:modification methylase
VVRADGSLISGLLTGSIHKLGATLAGQPACNGWDHWYFAAPDGTLHVINELREQLRAEAPATAP